MESASGFASLDRFQKIVQHAVTNQSEHTVFSTNQKQSEVTWLTDVRFPALQLLIGLLRKLVTCD